MYNGIGLTTPRGSGTNGHVQRNWALVKPKERPKTYQTEEELANLDVAPNRQPNQEILDHERKRKIELKCAEFADILEEQGFSEQAIINKVNNYRNLLMGKGDNLDKSVDQWGRIKNRCPVNERLIFERLWRGAFSQPLRSKTPYNRSLIRKECCCHCHCSDKEDPFYYHTIERKPLRSMISVTETHQVAEAQQEKNARLREAFGISEYFVDGSSFDQNRVAKEKIARSNDLQEKEKQRIIEREKEKIDSTRYELVHTPSPEPSIITTTTTTETINKKKKKRKHKDSTSSEEVSNKKKKKSKKRKKERSGKSKEKKKSKKKKQQSSSSESSDDHNSDDDESDSDDKKKKKSKKKDKKKKSAKRKRGHSTSESSRESSPDNVKTTKNDKKIDKSKEKSKSNRSPSVNRISSPKQKRKQSPQKLQPPQSTTTQFKNDTIRKESPQRRRSRSPIKRRSRDRIIHNRDNNRNENDRHYHNRRSRSLDYKNRSKRRSHSSNYNHRHFDYRRRDRRNRERSQSINRRDKNKYKYNFDKVDRNKSRSPREERRSRSIERKYRNKSPSFDKRNKSINNSKSTTIINIQRSRSPIIESKTTKRHDSRDGCSLNQRNKSKSPDPKYRNRSPDTTRFKNKSPEKSKSPPIIIEKRNDYNQSLKRDDRKRSSPISKSLSNRSQSKSPKLDNQSSNDKNNKISLTPKIIINSPTKSDNQSDSDNKRKLNKEKKLDKYGRPLPVVRLRSSSTEPDSDSNNEKDDIEEDHELNMLRILKSDLAAKAKESLQKKIPKPSITSPTSTNTIEANVFDIKTFNNNNNNNNNNNINNSSSNNNNNSNSTSKNDNLKKLVDKDDFNLDNSMINGKTRSISTSKSRSRSPLTKKSKSRSRSSSHSSDDRESSSSSSSSRSHSKSYSRSSRSSSSSSTSSSTSSTYRSRSPSIPRRHGSPSFLDRRRITRHK